MPERQHEEVPEAAVEAVAEWWWYHDRREFRIPWTEATEQTRKTYRVHVTPFLATAMDPALGEERLVPYEQARAEVLGEVLEVLRGYSILLHPDECAARLARHFDLPTQGVQITVEEAAAAQVDPKAAAHVRAVHENAERVRGVREEGERRG